MEHMKDTSAFITTFGQRVKALRELNNLTQFDLASKAGMDIRQIQRIEYGKINTSIGNAYLIARALEVSLGELFDFD
jgi:transcriptional regulator with XRE-family HTH domain